MDAELFDFKSVRATGAPNADGDTAFDDESPQDALALVRFD
jgi:hypothetical protein